jgi:hypothetical protein
VGWVLDSHFGRVEHWLDPVTEGIWAPFAALYLLRVAGGRRTTG